MTCLSKEQLQRHDLAATCYLCNNMFTEDNIKVRDHNHLTGVYRGPARNGCNINYKLPHFIPVVLHNLSGYDSHFIVPERRTDDGAMDVLAATTDRFICFSKKFGKIKLRFVDSFRFTPSSLMTLTEDLIREDLIQTSKILPNDKVDLVLRKGIFPYDYMDGLLRFNENTLPQREHFRNKLNDMEIKPEEYDHACRVWDELDMRTLGTTQASM